MDWYAGVILFTLGFMAGAYVEHFQAYKKGYTEGETQGWIQANRRYHER